MHVDWIMTASKCFMGWRLRAFSHPAVRGWRIWGGCDPLLPACRTARDGVHRTLSVTRFRKHALIGFKMEITPGFSNYANSDQQYSGAIWPQRRTASGGNPPH